MSGSRKIVPGRCSCRMASCSAPQASRILHRSEISSSCWPSGTSHRGALRRGTIVEVRIIPVNHTMELSRDSSNIKSNVTSCSSLYMYIQMYSHGFGHNILRACRIIYYTLVEIILLYRLPIYEVKGIGQAVQHF